MTKKILAVTLLLAMLVSVVACAKTEEKKVTSQSVENVTTDDGYDFGELDCQGADFTFLQCDEDRWNMITAVAPEDLIGEVVSDAIYARNARISELYNVNIKCKNEDIYETGNYIRTLVSSGDSSIDAAFVIGENVPSLIVEECLSDISSTPNIQIYEPWWNQTIRESSQFMGSSELYFAQSDISVTAFELTWCMAVNLDIIDEHQMENPYDLVKSGKWTIEKMLQMAKQGMESNSDGSYDYRENTTCVLGMVTYVNFAQAALNGSGCFLTQKDAIGLPTFTGEGERFLDVFGKWVTASNLEGMEFAANDEAFHYEEIFSDGRAVFVGTEVKGVRFYKTQELNYGILPVPKYSEEQESYYSNVNYLSPVLVIPKTNINAEATGRILDAMAYISHKDILPKYYDANLSYQSLKDPESIEMLNIIRDTRCHETSLLFGWTTDYYLELRRVFGGLTSSSATSSIIATNRDKVKSNINKYIAEIK